MSPLCFARKLRNSPQMRAMSWGIGNPCKASGFLVHSQFLYVLVHSFTWRHESWSPGHKEHRADCPAQGNPAASGVVAVQVDNAAVLLPIHEAPPRAQIPDDFNTCTPGFAWSKDLPTCSAKHLPCQTGAMALSGFLGMFSEQNTQQGSSCAPALPSVSLQPPAHKPSSRFPWLNQELR